MDLLTLSLDTVATLAIVDEANIEKIMEANRFQEPTGDESNGFYDYMRTNADTIVGLRWSPFPEATFVLDKVPQSDFLTTAANGRLTSLRVWFSGLRSFDDSISDDQLFSYNRIYVNPQTAGVIITFGLPDPGPNLDALRELLPNGMFSVPNR
jgi:hypothetical protein